MKQSITKRQIEKLLKQSHTVRLVDIRTPAEYEKMHVPGAVNVPAEVITANIATFDSKDIIVCICNKGKERSQNAAESMHAMGLENVFYLKEGTVGWLGESIE